MSGLRLYGTTSASLLLIAVAAWALYPELSWEVRRLFRARRMRRKGGWL